VGDVAGRPDVEHARSASGIDADESSLIDVAAQRFDQAVIARVQSRPDEDRGAGDGATGGQLHGAQAIVYDGEPRDKTVDHVYSSRIERRPLARGDGVRVREEDDVVRPLP